MSEQLEPYDSDEPVPKPSWLLLVTGWFVIAQSVLWTAIALAGCIQGDPFAYVAAVLLLPFAAFFGLTQYGAIVRHSAAAAETVGVALAVICALWIFALIANVGEAIVANGIEWRFLVGFIGFFLAIAVQTGITAWANRRWARSLRISNATRMVANRPIFTLRELFGAVTVIAITTGIASFLVRSDPGKFGEHVARSDGPAGLPAGATDISFGKGYRGTIAYEFTIDEQGFIDWVNAGLGSIEAQSAGVKLQPINGFASIRRYLHFGPNGANATNANVKNGLNYHWSKQDRGVHAIFDWDTNRAYYEAHYH